MDKKLSNNIWLRAARGRGDGTLDERLKALVRFLARRAAEEDYRNAVRSAKPFNTKEEKFTP
jgi:hypothetical protein